MSDEKDEVVGNSDPLAAVVEEGERLLKAATPGEWETMCQGEEIRVRGTSGEGCRIGAFSNWHDNVLAVHLHNNAEALFAAAKEVKVLREENERLRAHLMTISTDFRTAAGYDAALKAYCMRSEAQVALGLTRQETWDAEIARIHALMARPDKEWPCGCIETRPECPYGKKHCPDCCCDGCVDVAEIAEVQA